MYLRDPCDQLEERRNPNVSTKLFELFLTKDLEN